jgi:hypothetical protein
VAITAFLLGLIVLSPSTFGFRPGHYIGTLTARAAQANLLMGGIWIILFISGLFIHKWRGLWLLVGIPFVAFLPTISMLINYACIFHRQCP